MRRMLMILVLTLGFLFPTFVWAEIYKWVDEKGTIHFTEDPGTIPEKQAEKTQPRPTGATKDDPSKQFNEDERITYYYRDPRPDELISILESISREMDTLGNSKRVKPLVHFFATALQKDTNKVRDLKTLQQSHPGEAGRLIQTIAEEAKNYHPADPKSPEELELLWYEYKASGNIEIIEQLIKVIIAATGSKENNLRDPAAICLMKIATYHSEVFKMLRRRSESSAGSKSNLLAEIVGTINHFAFDPANEHLTRGLNLYNEKKYDEAMQEFNKSLSYVPDYRAAYMNIANIHDDQKNFWEAIKAGKRAVSIEPDNPGALSNLALYYQHLNEQDEAVKWYRKCLEYAPKKTDCHYGLGLAYMSKRDKDKAAFHFKKYLEYAPDGNQANFVRQSLASIGQTVQEDPTNIPMMLQNKRYDVLEKHLLSLLRERNRDKDGQFLLNLAYQKLCNVEETQNSYAKRVFQLKAWLTQQNSSHFANACLGNIYIRYAWYARGGGFANTITEEGNRLFEERLSTAKDYLEKAYSLDQSDAAVPAKLITVATGLGLERNEMERQFQRAILADPTDHQAYYNKLMYLTPKWFGSKEEMFFFARESVKKAPTGSRIPGVLLAAHWEMYFRSGNDSSYFRDPNTWKEMKEVYRILTKTFPETKTTHNWFARTAYLAGDYETAREELKKIGDDWDKDAWGNKNAFEEVKRELSMK
jgi:tetratricopeptide (TPR) repeat protein